MPNEFYKIDKTTKDTEQTLVTIEFLVLDLVRRVNRQVIRL